MFSACQLKLGQLFVCFVKKGFLDPLHVAWSKYSDTEKNWNDTEKISMAPAQG